MKKIFKNVAGIFSLNNLEIFTYNIKNNKKNFIQNFEEIKFLFWKRY